MKHRDYRNFYTTYKNKGTSENEELEAANYP